LRCYQETSRACCEIELRARAITPDDGHDKFARPGAKSGKQAAHAAPNNAEGARALFPSLRICSKYHQPTMFSELGSGEMHLIV
jgi:hypothetical protein